MFKSKTIRYSLEKNEILKSRRDVSFEDVILALENGCLLDDITHPNKEKYPNQYIYVISETYPQSCVCLCNFIIIFISFLLQIS